MIGNKKIFFLGLFLFILPFLGLPLWWKFAFVVILALVFMIISLDFTYFKTYALPLLEEMSSEAGVPIAPIQPERIPERIAEKLAEKPAEKTDEKEHKRMIRPRKKKVDTIAVDVHSIDF